MSGGSSSGNYGELGIPDESNTPPPSEAALGWSDLNGNFWLFGGCNRGMTKDYSDMNFV
jgi:hypothetical protein